MIPVHLLVTRVPLQDGTFSQHLHDAECFISAQRIDTVSTVTDEGRKTDHLPDRVRSVLRYLDALSGYRLMYVAERADEISRMVMRSFRGDDPAGPDFPPNSYSG
mgnify:CR=1 FL=1